MDLAFEICLALALIAPVRAALAERDIGDRRAAIGLVSDAAEENRARRQEQLGICSPGQRTLAHDVLVRALTGIGSAADAPYSKRLGRRVAARRRARSRVDDACSRQRIVARRTVPLQVRGDLDGVRGEVWLFSAGRSSADASK